MSAATSLAEAGADVKTMFNRVARRYDAANRIMSAGIDVVWRKKLPPGAAIDTHAADGHHLPYGRGAFDGAFSAFCVRNLRDLRQGLAELRRVVRPGGRVVILEFLRPEKRRFFFDLYNNHVLPLVGWAVTGDRAAYRYLPDSIAAFRSPEEFVALLREVGFDEATATPLFPSGVASMVVAS